MHKHEVSGMVWSYGTNDLQIGGKYSKHTQAIVITDNAKQNSWWFFLYIYRYKTMLYSGLSFGIAEMLHCVDSPLS